MRFRIIELLVVLTAITFSITSLVQSTPQLESIFYTFTLLTILFAFLMAIARGASNCSFWLAFAFAASAYLGFAHVPDKYGNSPRQIGPEMTTQLLRLTYNWTRDSWEQETIIGPQPGGIFSIQDETDSTIGDDPFSDSLETDSSEFPPDLSITYGAGQQIASAVDLSAFMRIGHCFCALLIGYVSGHFVKWMRAWTMPGQSTPNWRDNN